MSNAPLPLLHSAFTIRIPMTNPYLSANRIRAALRGLDLRPTRGMGQNFLMDSAALETIVAAGEVAHDDTVLEVGPGLGVLTWELLQRAGRVVAVELDKRLAARLHEEFPNAANLSIVQGDILRLPPRTILAQAGIAEPLPPCKLIANLPYAITSPVLRHFLEADCKPEVMVLLIQREVAQRIVAPAGDLSVLAHSIQLYAAPEIIAEVPPESFFPAPAVTSAIVRLRLFDKPAVDVDNIDAFFRIIKAGFLQSRKKLSNALPSGLAAMGQPRERADVLAALDAAGVAAERRAETLTLNEWAAVYRALAS